MEWVDSIESALLDREVGTVAHVPDSAIAPLVERLTDVPEIDTVRATREEQAAGIVSGTWLGGGRGALVCQSSGLANTLNAIGSLNKAARVPFLGIVTRRGGPGEFNYAQVPFGYNMDGILDQLGVRNESVDDDTDVERAVSWGAKTAFSTGEPYVLVLEPSLLGVKDE